MRTITSLLWIPQRSDIESIAHYCRRVLGLAIWQGTRIVRRSPPLVRWEDLQAKGGLNVYCRSNVLVAGRSIARHMGGRSELVPMERLPGPTGELSLVVSPIQESELPDRFVAYQLEPLIASPALSWSHLRKLQRASLILDYSSRNRVLLERFGFSSSKTLTVPICPTQVNSSSEIVPYEDRDIDVLFFGWTQSPRRQEALKSLSQNLNVTVIQDTYGEDMDRIISRAKLCVNIHFYKNALLEQVRIAQCFSQGTPVISETSNDQEEWAHASSVLFTPAGLWTVMASRAHALLSEQEAWKPVAEGTLHTCSWCESSNKSVSRHST